MLWLIFSNARTSCLRDIIIVRAIASSVRAHTSTSCRTVSLKLPNAKLKATGASGISRLSILESFKYPDVIRRICADVGENRCRQALRSRDWVNDCCITVFGLTAKQNTNSGAIKEGLT